MRSNNVKVTIPDEMREEMEIQSTIVNPVNPDVAILVMSKGLNHFSNEIVIRLYLLQKNHTDHTFDIQYELEAFMFLNYKQARNFIKRLPNMSGLEMLLLLNPQPPVTQLQ
ncbi:hypothetical protein [Jeotgalibacillus terrae]|uniref:Uncharacterized protein n=1 Tax=Jeotgalibacillus terrae TaxID=587735 RepID=A0ABW5ZHE9_9BACL|nr:hypothetical protein [Jeotgalibacillus terrae]MBM7580814.1 hypothetical protein [Jeotgalibacillus terrae]